jgi:Flp pilus assembly pilin Flp
MSTLRNHLRALINDERGVPALEYGRIAGRIAVIVVTSITASGTKLHGTFTSIAAAPP